LTQKRFSTEPYNRNVFKQINLKGRMKRVHIAPYIVLTILGLVLVFSLETGFGVLLGFVIAVLGASGCVYHLMVDEHISV